MNAEGPTPSARLHLQNNSVQRQFTMKAIIGINMEPIDPPAGISKPFDVFTVNVYTEPSGVIKDTYEFDTKMEAHNFVLGFMQAIEFTHKKWAIGMRDKQGLLEDTITNNDTL
jgi:hypothetical protein